MSIDWDAFEKDLAEAARQIKEQESKPIKTFYIRINDSIISFPSNELFQSDGRTFVTINNHVLCLYNYKYSSNLEELFDRFVLKNYGIICLNKEHTQYRFEESDEVFDITDSEINVGIYGGIWTDEGLIYKAKMNKNREFALLYKENL